MKTFKDKTSPCTICGIPWFDDELSRGECLTCRPRSWESSNLKRRDGGALTLRIRLSDGGQWFESRPLASMSSGHRLRTIIQNAGKVPRTFRPIDAGDM